MKRTAKIIGILIITLAFATSALASYSGKKVLFIDSYHQGYAWSDGVHEGVQTGLTGKGVELKVVRMDTKRNKDEAFKQEAALKVKAVIESFKPDIVIAADDNAAKYLIAPYYKNASLPFVFCGVNWDASGYGLPFKNATGMVEVAPVSELLGQLQGFAKGSRIGFVATDVLTIHKEVDNYKKVLNLDVNSKLVKTMAEWKQAIVDIQGQVDMLIIGNTAGLEGWNEQEAMDFLLANSKVPTGAVDDHMAQFAMLGFTKLPQEQGFYAAETALKILDGASPASIPVVKNKDGRLTVNIKIAMAASVEMPYELIGSADQIIE